MLLTYRKDTNQVITIVQGFPKVWEIDNQLRQVSEPIILIRDLTQLDWGYYADKVIPRHYDEEGEELPIYLNELDLSVTADELPKSMHIAALVAVDAPAKKGTVARLWQGEVYTYSGCHVTQQAMDAYIGGNLKVYDTNYGWNDPENADSYVWVYFISESPFDTALEIPLIGDKVVK